MTATLEAAAADAPRFFPSLLAAMRKVQAQGEDVQVVAFTGLMDAMVGFFDHLGPALHIAKAELVRARKQHPQHGCTTARACTHGSALHRCGRCS